MPGYRDLHVWQKSMALVLLVYRYTEGFPKSEQYGLTSQMRRSAVSLPSNIAEGSRRSKVQGKEFQYFIRVAFSSGAELETHIDIARGLHFLSQEDHHMLFTSLQEIMRMLSGMLRR